MSPVPWAILSGFLLAALAAATPAFVDTLSGNFAIAYGGNVRTFSQPSSPKMTTQNGSVH